jgi:hypothetical protein
VNRIWALRQRNCSSNSITGKKTTFCSLNRPDRPWSLSSLLITGYRKPLFGTKRQGLEANCSAFFFYPAFATHLRVLASSFLRFRDHTQGHTIVGRTPLDEWSARRRDLYLTNSQNSQQTNIHALGRILFSVLHLYYYFVLIVLTVPFVLIVQHTQHKHPCPRRDSNPQAIGRRPTP